MSIRELQEKDLENGFLDTLSALTDVSSISLETARSTLQKLGKNIITFVFDLNGTIVGTGSLVLLQKFSHGARCAGLIEDLSVHGDYQGNGIGSKLVQHLINVAKQQGCYKIILNCNPENVAFYERLNFIQKEVQMRIDL